MDFKIRFSVLILYTERMKKKRKDLQSNFREPKGVFSFKMRLKRTISQMFYLLFNSKILPSKIMAFGAIFLRGTEFGSIK